MDAAAYVYVSGRAGPGFPTTPKAFQPTFQGANQGAAYGSENGFVARLAPDGSRIVWASYAGAGYECRDMALDDEGSIYLTLPYSSASTSHMPESWFANAFENTPHGAEDCGIIKIANDGTRVLWASFIGGSRGNNPDSSLCVGRDHCPVLFMGTRSTDMPTTAGAFSRNSDSSWLGKLSADGSGLMFGTYIGDGATALPRTHAAAMDRQGNLFVGVAPSGRWPVTAGAFQATFGGGKADFGVALRSRDRQGAVPPAHWPLRNRRGSDRERA